MSKALLMIDFVNENVSPQGKMAGKGYPVFCEHHKTLENAETLLNAFRSKGLLIVHVRVGFSPDYKEQPAFSPLFGAANQFGAFKIGDVGDEFWDSLKPIDGEIQLYKHRVSAFFATPLELILRNNNISELYICGVATDLAVQAATRDAHDRDFITTVVEDCCGAANDDDHNNSLVPLKKISRIATLSEILKEI